MMINPRHKCGHVVEQQFTKQSLTVGLACRINNPGHPYPRVEWVCAELETHLAGFATRIDGLDYSLSKLSGSA